MKKLYFLMLLLLQVVVIQKANSQNVGINATGASPHASAMLDISSNNSGLLIPRMAEAQKNAISSPLDGLLIYQIDGTKGFYFYNGSSWLLLSLASTSPWSTTGNSGTLWNTNFLGTSDNRSLRFRTNNLQGLMIDSLGNVGIGSAPVFSAAPNSEKFLVDAGSTGANPATSYNLISGKGYINNYLQLNIQNKSPGAAASSDVVATADNGGETNHYVDMGINSSGNTSNYFGTSNDAYLYNIGQNLLIGTGTANKSLLFLTGGGTQITNERMRIDGSGNVGIGTHSPLYKLHVSATSNPLGLGGLQSGTAEDSLLTVSNGVVKRLSPSLLNTSGSAWQLTGNTGSMTAKLGTTADFDLPIITNNTTKMTITSSGDIGIGSTDFDPDQPEKLLIDGGTTASANLIGAYANVNNYVQIGVQNLSSGNNASSDIVATADNGTNSTNYIDMGINSSGYTNNNSNILNRPNVGYLYTNATSDFFIGNGASNQGMVLFTNNGAAGNTTANGNEAMRIDGNGNIGIGGTSRNNQGVVTTNPEKLVVSGNIVPRTSGNGTLGTSTYKWNAVYATNSLIQTSDLRLKTNIKSLNYGLTEVLAMHPVSFNWTATPDTDTKLGLIAQDVRKIVPEIVVGDEMTGTLSMSYTDLIPVLINAIKEQQKQIDDLKLIIRNAR